MKAELCCVEHREEHIHEDERDAIEEYLDWLHPDPMPETITLIGYRRAELPPAQSIADDIIEHHEEWIQENWGCDDHSVDPWRASAAVRAAALVLAEAIRADVGEPWACDPTGETEEIDVRAWLAENRPEWLPEVQP